MTRKPERENGGKKGEKRVGRMERGDSERGSLPEEGKGKKKGKVMGNVRWGRGRGKEAGRAGKTSVCDRRDTGADWKRARLCRFRLANPGVKGWAVGKAGIAPTSKSGGGWERRNRSSEP